MELQRGDQKINRNASKEPDALFCVNKTCFQQSFTILTLSSFASSPDLLELFKTKRTRQLESYKRRASQGNSITNSQGNIVFMKTVY